MPVIPTPNRAANPHVSVAVWSVSKLNVIWEKMLRLRLSKSERFTLQADGEIRQNLGEGWFLKL
ncbi:major outer membrane protein [Neisseria gonorrhoeae]|uniref:Major outer membrane protein n=1 Tax=Neisseria gonorrhoeae TaxID=485 RepID=A0A378VU02_NEIGO|nr:major outer membrane protein [Neisseria gonorrhoeae]